MNVGYGLAEQVFTAWYSLNWANIYRYLTNDANSSYF